jgi:drug/metabolite transporter (DMT)-like permease
MSSGWRSSTSEPSRQPLTKSDRLPLAGLLHLFIVYVVWGSTYLAIRVAVREGAGFPPFLLGGTRILTAGLILLGWNLARGARLRPSRREWIVLGISGPLMWVGGNGLVNWAERHADSGYAALLVGALPMWIALIESGVDRRPPSPRLVAWILVGFCGLFLLSWPVLRHGIRADAFALVALLLAPLWWGIGLVIQKRRPVLLASTATSEYLQLLGGIAMLGVGLATGEPMPRPTLSAWIAWGYLVVAGSILAFTSFLRALQFLPARVVATYSYANPIIAVALGWLLLGERITGWTIAGAVFILVGIAGTFRVREHVVRGRAEPEAPAPARRS